MKHKNKFKKYTKSDIREFMSKKDKEIKHKEKKKHQTEAKTQTKVLKNLQKLDKKRKKMIASSINSKSSLNIYNLNKTDRSELGLAANRNSSMFKSASKNKLSSNKMFKTQKKPKATKIKNKGETPSKILSSDSELGDVTQNEYAEYLNINSENQEKNKQVHSQRDSMNGYEPPPQMNQIENDEFRGINEGNQHGWLASQQTSENDMVNQVTNSIKQTIDHNKLSQNVMETANEVFKTPSVMDKEDNNIEKVPFAFKRDYESILNRKSCSTTPDAFVNRRISKSFNPHKPFYKSIIAITAAIVLQNYWREYRRRKLTRHGDPELGKSVLERIKKKIENNTSLQETSVKEDERHRYSSIDLLEESKVQDFESCRLSQEVKRINENFPEQDVEKTVQDKENSSQNNKHQTSIQR